MKNTLKILGVLILALSLTACNDDKKLDTTNNNSTNITSNNTNSSVNNTTSNNVLNDDKEDNQIDEEEPKETNEVITETQTCTSGKFTEKYKYYYATKDECTRESQSTAFFDITDNVDDRVFTVNCDEIVDECGTTWYGVSYNIYDPDNSPNEDGVVVVHY